jgi:ankyrin repeat protein
MFALFANMHDDDTDIPYQYAFTKDNRYLQAELHEAIAAGNLESIELCLDRGAFVDDEQALAAAQNGHLKILRLLLNHHDKLNISVLFWRAVTNMHYDVAQYLISTANFYNMRIYIHNYQEYYMAAKLNRLDMLELLATLPRRMYHIATIPQMKNEWDHPLFVAAEHGHTDIVQFIIQQIPEISSPIEQQVALEKAATCGHLAIVQLICRHPNVASFKVKVYGALRIAAKAQHVAVARAILTLPFVSAKFYKKSKHNEWFGTILHNECTLMHNTIINEPAILDIANTLDCDDVALIVYSYISSAWDPQVEAKHQQLLRHTLRRTRFGSGG